MNSITILMYHQVGEFAPMKNHRATFCHIRNFRKQMRFLKRFGYSVLSLSDAWSMLREARPIPKRAVVLTFDDGYDNFREYAFPELRRHDFPSTVFLVANKIGGRADWLLDDAMDAPPLLDRETILDLRRQGVDFQSHGCSHSRLSKLPVDEARREIAGSKTTLESLMGEPVRFLCYPYGDYDPTTVDLAREAGYEAAVTCRRGRAVPEDPPLELPRIAVSYGTGLAGFYWKLRHQKA